MTSLSRLVPVDTTEPALLSKPPSMPLFAKFIVDPASTSMVAPLLVSVRLVKLSVPAST